MPHSDFWLAHEFYEDGEKLSRSNNQKLNFIIYSKLILNRLLKAGRVKNWNVPYAGLLILITRLRGPVDKFVAPLYGCVIYNCNGFYPAFTQRFTQRAG